MAQPSTPQSQPKSKVKGTFKSFTSILEFDEFFSQIVPDNTPIPNGGGTYKEVYDSVNRRTLRDYINGSDRENIRWFGLPKVESLAEGLSRSRYLNMDDFNRVLMSF